MLSIIVPTLNEAACIVQSLEPLQVQRRGGHEVLVVDGGSVDHTVELATPLADQVLVAPPGRARQMNAGAAAAQGSVLLFLHADTRMPADFPALIAGGLGRRVWGRFDVSLSGSAPLLRVIEAAMNWRSRLSGIATGDQAIFVRTEVFRALGGYAEIPLMEDIELSRRLRAFGPPVCISARATTSSRRWERNGIVTTVLLMWRLRLAYALGADPARLARQYGVRDD